MQLYTIRYCLNATSGLEELVTSVNSETLMLNDYHALVAESRCLLIYLNSNIGRYTVLKIQLVANYKQKSSTVTLTKFYLGIAFLTCIGLLSAAHPALAHHAIGGKTPSNFFEGFLSGLAHPVIGLDHFAFVVAIGLLSARQQNGLLIPVAFVLTAMAGTGIHILKFDLPLSEIVIASSVIAFGAMLLLSKKPNWFVLALLGAVAGLFHGYAYGESIVGAQMTPLVAYLAGFTLIQYGIAIGALLIGKVVSEKFANQFLKILQFIGLAICSIGVVFLTTSLVG
ncbi:HupE/UreJ family protein [Nostoc sp. KVJ20]|uniref:HupE/UreJ family protein n=1 Tax=Nostoc sp. KVJ20 TaxID=457944 RepID=UPI000B0FB397|nr:HupE/UreJ family protein [Nostoc sp. KVJ20]